MRTIDCERELSVGAEHHVYIASGGKTVVKTPTDFGRFWHNMHAQIAHRDQKLLKYYEIPHIPTTVEGDPIFIQINGTRKLVNYVVTQPFVDAKPLNFLTIAENPELLAAIFDMIEKSEKLFEETRLGVDLVGGKAIIDLFLTFFRWRVNVILYNVLVPGADQCDENGKVFAPAGKPVLCDTKLYDCSGPFGNPFSTLRENVYHLQYELLHRFLDELKSYHSARAMELKTLWHRIAAAFIHVFVKGRLSK